MVWPRGYSMPPHRTPRPILPSQGPPWFPPPPRGYLWMYTGGRGCRGGPGGGYREDLGEGYGVGPGLPPPGRVPPPPSPVYTPLGPSQGPVPDSDTTHWDTWGRVRGVPGRGITASWGPLTGTGLLSRTLPALPRRGPPPVSPPLPYSHPPRGPTGEPYNPLPSQGGPVSVDVDISMVPGRGLGGYRTSPPLVPGVQAFSGVQLPPRGVPGSRRPGCPPGGGHTLHPPLPGIPWVLTPRVQVPGGGTVSIGYGPLPR